MGDIVQLQARFRQNSKAARQAALLERFANTRRGPDDVFWLKENAEMLNLLECTGAAPGVQALSLHGGFYQDIEKRMGFFPQYYRFLLSICLDLEDLGMAGAKGAALVRWVADEGLVRAELSDLQRAEARRLCLRRGVDPVADDGGLDDRLRAFGARSQTFALPNKKAAYELTHIVFYLSEYGRRAPELGQTVIDGLQFAGTLAFLELNSDLLAEICIALRFAGQTPPEIWENWLRDQAGRFVIAKAGDGAGAGRAPVDDYHPYLMVNWFMMVSGQGGFGQHIPEGPVLFVAPKTTAGPLRELSESLYGMDGSRSTDWQAMRDAVGDRLSDDARIVLTAAEAAVDFEAFFAGFARAGLPGAGR